MDFIKVYQLRVCKLVGGFLTFCAALLALIYLLVGRESLFLIACLAGIYAVCSAIVLVRAFLPVKATLRGMAPGELDRLCADYARAPKFKNVAVTDTHLVCTDFLAFRIIHLGDVMRVQIETPYGNRYTGRGQPVLMVQQRSTGKRCQWRLPRDGRQLEGLLRLLEGKIGPVVYR